MTALLNIREQEVVTELGGLVSFQRRVMDHVNGEYAGEVRKVLAFLATAIDFRRHHPKPGLPPFQGRKPRFELPIFFLGCGFVKADYVCVGVHEDGWVVLFTTYVTSQPQLFSSERYIAMVADWETSSIPWLVEAGAPDRRPPTKLPNSGNLSNIELYPIFLDKAYAINPST